MAPLASVTVPLMLPVALWPTSDTLDKTSTNNSAAAMQAREAKIRVDLSENF